MALELYWMRGCLGACMDVARNVVCGVARSVSRRVVRLSTGCNIGFVCSYRFIGLIGLILVKVLAPAFYAQQNIKTPVKIAIFTLFCTQFMNLIFIGYFKHAGLALAVGLGACINAGLLFYFLKKYKYFKLETRWLSFLIKIILALVVMALFLLYARGTIEEWASFGLLSKISRLFFLVSAGSAVYFTTLFFLGIKLKELLNKKII